MGFVVAANCVCSARGKIGSSSVRVGLVLCCSENSAMRAKASVYNCNWFSTSRWYMWAVQPPKLMVIEASLLLVDNHVAVIIMVMAFLRGILIRTSAISVGFLCWKSFEVSSHSSVENVNAIRRDIFVRFAGLMVWIKIWCKKCFKQFVLVVISEFNRSFQ